MKKVLSIILSLLMVISCMTCLFSGPAGTAMAAKPSVNFRGENLLADYTAEDFWNVDGNAASTPTDTTLQSGDDSITAISLGNTIWQAYGFEVDLEANKTYEFEMGVKANYSLTLIKIYKASEYTEKSVSSTSGNYVVNQSFELDVTEGATVPSSTVAANAYRFNITETDKYVFIFKFGGTDNSNGAYNEGFVYNFGLWEASVEVKANVEGNGAVAAEKVTNGVKFTATPYQDSDFLGWYEGESLVASEPIYTYSYSEVASYTVTAKFTDVNLLADYGASKWFWKDGNNKSFDISESVYGGKCVRLHDPRYQAIYTTVSLEANSTYKFSTLAYGYSDLEGYRVFKAEYLDITSVVGEATSTGDYIVNAKKDLAINSSTEAAEYAFSFETKEAGDYIIVLRFGGREESAKAEADGWSTYISDMSLIKSVAHQVTVTSEGNGAGKASAASVKEGKTVTFTATPYQDSSFIGWYNGEELVSEDAVYSMVVKAPIALTAKFTDVNLVHNKNTSDNWYALTYTRSFDDVTATDSHLGGKAIKKHNSGIGWQWSTFKMTLKPNTTYTLQFSIKATNELYALSIRNGVTFSGETPNGTISSTYTKDILGAAGDLSLEDWQIIIREFTTPASENDEELYYLYFQYGDPQEHFTGDYQTETYSIISDISVVNSTAYTVSATTQGNGAVKTSKTKTNNVTTYTLTAKPYLDSEFIGWYNGDDLLSTNSVYECVATENLTLTAKFTDINLVENLNIAANWAKGQYSWVTISDSDDTCSGGKAVAFTKTVQYQAAYLPITLKPNTKYGMSLDYMVKGVGMQEILLIGPDLSISSGKDAGGMRDGGTVIETFFSTTEGGELAEFKNYSGFFVTPDSEEETITCYLYIKHNAPTTGEVKAVISDLSIAEYEVAESLTVDMKSCAAIVPLNFELESINVGKSCKFEIVDNMETDPVVTVNGAVLTPVNGVYTFTSQKDNSFSVRFEGDENLNDYNKDYSGNDLSVYNDDLYLTNIWEGNIVYHETALFSTGREEVKLLYPVDKVISLRSYDLKTNYVEGVDYEITAEGNIKILPGSRIPVYEGGLTTDVEPTYKFALRDNENKWLKAIGDTTYTQYAIAVTYEHSKTHSDGYTPAAPAAQTSALSGTLAKLKAGETVNIVIFGDSISCGWSSSGLNNTEVYDKDGNLTSAILNVAPYAPTWAEMVIARLREMYPNATINVKNLSLSGMDAKWGANNIATRLTYWKDNDGNQVVPDLLLTGFGVNDSAGNVSAADFKAYMQSIIDNARTAGGNANMEVLLYSGMLPNQLTDTWDAETKMVPYENAMKEIAAADSKVGVAAVTSVFTEIIKSKNPEDYLNTNWNHGNDFTARIYATTILAAFGKVSDEDFVPGDVNGDGRINNRDLTRIQQYVNGWDVEIIAKASDVNGDGRINNRDLTRLQQYINGWDVTLS